MKLSKAELEIVNRFIRNFSAKFEGEAKYGDYMIMITDHHISILAPARPRTCKERIVQWQFSRRE